MHNSYDVIVVGLGAMGSATLHQLARRGLRVLGVDQFTPPHGMGSSHGKSRIIREAYFEDPRYVPLVQRAYECWRALEEESGTSIFRQTGGLMLGAATSDVVRGARQSAELHGLPHEVLGAEEVRRRVPAIRPQRDDIGIVEPRAGMLAPEAAIQAALDMAVRHGATVQTNEPLLSWRAVGDGIEITTSLATYHADRLILAVGAWATKVFRELELPFVVQRNVQFWFAPLRHPGQFTPQQLPIFIHELSNGLAWYGFPDTGDGVKLALHHHGESVDPDQIRRTVDDHEVAFMRDIVQTYMPDANGPLREASVCMYTNLPDGHFIIDRHPLHASVIVASPCSGHGFKFSGAIGEVLADMAMDRPVAFDTSLFSLSRFAH